MTTIFHSQLKTKKKQYVRPITKVIFCAPSLLDSLSMRVDTTQPALGGGDAKKRGMTDFDNDVWGYDPNWGTVDDNKNN